MIGLLATYIAKDIPYAAWKLKLLDDPFNYTKYEKTQPGGKFYGKQLSQKVINQNKTFFGEKVVTVIDSRQSRLQEIITSLWENSSLTMMRMFILVMNQ